MSNSAASPASSVPSTPLNPNAIEFQFKSEDDADNASGRLLLPTNRVAKKPVGRSDDADRHVRNRTDSGDSRRRESGAHPTIVKLEAQHFCYIRHQSSNSQRCEVGPATIKLTADETLAKPPTPFIVIPPDHFCVIRNPVRRDTFGSVLAGEDGRPKYRYGDKDVRMHGYGPFAVYPAEQVVEPVQRMQDVPADSALQLRALRAFLDKSAHLTVPTWRVANDTWLFMGPAQYLPHAEAEVVGLVQPIVVDQNTALEMRARSDFMDTRNGVLRSQGERWLLRTPGPFLPSEEEEVVQVVKGHGLTITEALHMRARADLTDAFGVQHPAGDEWLVTTRNRIVYIPDLMEEVVRTVQPTELSSTQYCVLLDTLKQGGQSTTSRKVVLGEKKFFVQPNQQLAVPPRERLTIGADEALEMEVVEDFLDKNATAMAVRSTNQSVAQFTLLTGLIAYLVAQPTSSFSSLSTIILLLGILLLVASLFLPRAKPGPQPRAKGTSYLVHGPLAEYVPLPQTSVRAKKRALLRVESLNYYGLYWSSS
jgi:hypothetical protein